MTDIRERVVELRRGRPALGFVRASLLLFCALMAYAWLAGGLSPGDLFTAERANNLARFASEIVPYPLQQRGELDAGVLAAWIRERLGGERTAAVSVTLAISIAAIVLAAIVGGALSVPAARTHATPEGLLARAARRPAAARTLRAGIVLTTRALLVFLRAVPEYVWAFLLIAIFGFSAWPAVLALAIHNAGILGKLTAETIENCDFRPARALRGLGAGRAQSLFVAIVPEIAGRFLLYFFYRWETCVREATVLGMLGVVSLGSLIRDARAANFYDEMVFYVLVGALLVLAGDGLSGIARGLVRRGG